MNAVRATLNRYVIAALVGWSVLMLLVQTFKGSNVGNARLCASDPTCGEVGWIPPAVWLGGIAVILVIGYATRKWV